MKILFVTIISVCVFSGFVIPNDSHTVSLSQEFVLKQVISESPYMQKKRLQKSRALAELLQSQHALYDWRIFSSFKTDRRKNPSLSPFTPLKEQTRSLDVGFEKPLHYGLSFKGVYSDSFNDRKNSSLLRNFHAPELLHSSQMALELNMDLFGNIFGREERMTLKSLDAGKDITNWEYLEAAENLALRAARAYWSAVMAQTAYRELQKSFKVYEKWVAQTERKQNYGFLKPGERSQALAEYENIKQEVAAKRQNLRDSIKELFLVLKIEALPEKAVFQNENLKPPSPIRSVDLESLRPFKITQKRLQEQKLKVRITKTQALPDLSLKGKVGNLAASRGESRNRWEIVSSPYQFYEVSLNFLYRPFSNTWREQVQGEELKLKEMEIDLNLLEREMKDRMDSLEKSLQIGFANVLSAKKSNQYQKTAFKELKKAFLQGRVDIFDLITAEHKLRQSEMTKTLRLSEYFLLNLKRQAFLDQLIDSRL